MPPLDVLNPVCIQEDVSGDTSTPIYYFLQPQFPSFDLSHDPVVVQIPHPYQ